MQMAKALKLQLEKQGGSTATWRGQGQCHCQEQKKKALPQALGLELVAVVRPGDCLDAGLNERQHHLR